MATKKYEWKELARYKYEGQQLWAVDIEYVQKGACKCKMLKTTMVFEWEPSPKDIINRLLN